MENLVRIIEQGAMQNFQSQSGETICKVSVVLTTGIDTFEAEAFDKLAMQLAQQPLSTDAMYAAQLQISVREWTNRDGQKNRMNTIRLLKIANV